MKKLFLMFALIFIGAYLTSCGSVKFNEKSGKIIIGLECDYAPFNWTEMEKSDTNYPIDNVKGAYAEGYDVQMAKMIADSLGYELVIKKIEWDGLIPALSSGAIDMIIAGMSPTEERKLKIDFSDAYYESTHVLLGLSTSSYLKAKKYNDLSGAKVVGQKNTIYDEIASEICTKNTNCKYLTALESVPLIVTAIKSGVADLTVLEEPVAKGLVAADSNLSYFKLDETFTLSEEDKIVSIGLRKVDKNLKNKINEALGKISSSKRLEMMSEAVERNA